MLSSSSDHSSLVETDVDATDSVLDIARSPTTIHTLPPELLIEIFVYCTSNDALVPIPLSRVCSVWKQVVDSSPRVWQLISLDDGRRSAAACRSHAILWLNRSSPLPFDVEINLQSADMLLPLLSPFLPAFHRWRHLTMTGRRDESVDLFPFSSRHTLDLLVIYVQNTAYSAEAPPSNTFTMADDPWREDSWRRLLWKADVGRIGPCWPVTATMNIRVTSLPHPSLVHSLHFTLLDIHESSPIDFETQPRTLLTFLLSCRALEVFYYKGWSHDNDVNDNNLPIVYLPRLHTLRLQATCCARAILSSLHTPSLSELHLEYLNVEFELPGFYDDDGDSEDEAHDFSQSPYSDQGTGMGLRTLITRSSPPLRILDMDYSDMRTKDFQWCFERMTMLEAFRIIASDMSDNVINLFKPFTSPLDDDSGGTVQVRLPRLTRLELYNCQRVSGSAVVNALSSRLDVTDTWSDPTLNHVSIVECDDFSYEHGLRLAQVLGTRLHLSE